MRGVWFSVMLIVAKARRSATSFHPDGLTLLQERALLLYLPCSGSWSCPSSSVNMMVSTFFTPISLAALLFPPFFSFSSFPWACCSHIVSCSAGKAGHCGTEGLGINSPLGRIWKFTFLDSYFMLSVAQADIIQDVLFFFSFQFLPSSN